VARLRIRPALAIALAVSAVVVSGCGSSSSGASSNGEAKKTGPEVVKDAAAALAASGAAHVTGTATDPSTKQTESLDLQLQSDGTSGSITSGGTKVDIVAVGGADYIKAPASFYVAQKATPAVAAKLGNQWVKSPSGSTFDSFTLAAISKSLSEPTDSSIEQKVTTGSLNGQEVVIVKQVDGSQLYVAATGKPYPLKTVNSAKSKNGAGTVTLTDFGKQVVIKAPAGALDASGATS
jgi:hypothetical protein